MSIGRHEWFGLRGFGTLCGLAVLIAPVTRGAVLPSGAQAVRTYCGACHLPDGHGHLARISDERKTPEGWVMTIFRMQNVHGLRLPDATRAVIVRYLADTQGLAPSEAAPARFALERRPNVSDLRLPENLQVLCARCHSAARIALQRRTTADWLKNANWHLAQFPTIEYQQNARDRHWWREASSVVPAQLGRLFPLQSKAWSAWQRHAPIDLAGHWLVRGYEPGRGSYWGTADIHRVAANEYRAVYRLSAAHGGPLDGNSNAIVYTGYEWRGTAILGGQHTHEVFAGSPDGRRITGRWFLANHPEIGADWTARRADESPQIVAVNPQAIRIGASADVTVFGDHLGGLINLGPGLQVRVIHRSATHIKLRVTVAASANPGYRTVRVGSARSPTSIAVYDRVDRIEVTPAYAIARLGGGKIDPVAAQFDDVAYEDIASAGGGTLAVNLGALPVRWTVAPFNRQAARDLDVAFAGHMNSTGRFLPAGAGPDPKRKFSADNTGNLFVIATLKAPVAANAAVMNRVVGKAHLIVTVQRWNTPPIY